MDFTCLGQSCVLLNVTGLHILLECPLDMSVLAFFLPSALHGCAKSPADSQPCSTNGRKSTKLDPYRSSRIPVDGSLNLESFSSSRKLQKFDAPLCRKQPADGQMDRLFVKSVNGQVFLDAEPWYKMAEFGLVDVSSIDCVLISNPEGMLGLPFLTRKAEFTGKIYATSPTAKLGQLMMEELVSMHSGYIQKFGRSGASKPEWLAPAILEALPQTMKKQLVDDDCVGRANWQSLYRKEDIDACMRKVVRLHYDEEVNIYDHVQVKPCSSGAEIGASNWIISGPRRCSYFSASRLGSGPASCLNLASHASSDVLLFSDVKSCREDSKDGILSTDQLLSASKAAVDAISARGSVLVTICGLGATLELLEAISQQLASSNMGHIPMFFVSPVAEEMLVYANTVPEWLCAARQDKLYAGEALFGHVELIKEERLHHLPALHAQKTVNVWKEPCVVFAAHWGLRIGPAIHLLCKWREDPRCLLIFTEGLNNLVSALAPFRPVCMKLLQYKHSEMLGPEIIAAFLEKLKPEHCLLPETIKEEFQELLGEKGNMEENVPQFYNMWDVLTIPVPDVLEMDMSAELACQFRPKQLESGIAVGRMTMSVQQKCGRWYLELPTCLDNKVSSSFAPEYDACWGFLKANDLVDRLREQGLFCEIRSQKEDETVGENDCECVVVSAPSLAKVELQQGRTIIETKDPLVRQVVIDTVKQLLFVM